MLHFKGPRVHMCMATGHSQLIYMALGSALLPWEQFSSINSPRVAELLHVLEWKFLAATHLPCVSVTATESLTPSRPPAFHPSTRARIGPLGNWVKGSIAQLPIQGAAWARKIWPSDYYLRKKCPHTNSAYEGDLLGDESYSQGSSGWTNYVWGKTGLWPIKQKGSAFSKSQNRTFSWNRSGSRPNQIGYSWNSLSEMG